MGEKSEIEEVTDGRRRLVPVPDRQNSSSEDDDNKWALTLNKLLLIIEQSDTNRKT